MLQFFIEFKKRLNFSRSFVTAEVEHYQKEVQLGYFGNRTTESEAEIPSNYPLHRITAPISIHYAVSDGLAAPEDVEKTLSKLTGTKDLHVQRIGGKFNHQVRGSFHRFDILTCNYFLHSINFQLQDFIWGTRANEIVYSEILQFFGNFSEEIGSFY